MNRLIDNRVFLYVSIALASVFISIWVVLTTDIINADGIRYLSVAQAFLDGGPRLAFDKFSWPFYGIIIGVVHQATSLSLENSAYLLNAFFLVIVCITFVRIYDDISSDDSRIWVAGILILALPLLNDYRGFVVRGYGSWAFMLLSLFYFIRYSRTPVWTLALKWQFAICLAILFRIESVAFLVLAPFYFLFSGEGIKKAVLRILQLNSGFIILAGIALMVALPGRELPDLGDSSTFDYWLRYASPGAIFGALDAESAWLHDRMQYLSSIGDARIILVSGLLTLVAVKVIKNVGVLALVVAGWGHYRSWLRLEKESYIVLLFAAIGILALVSLAGSRFFLSSRYTVLTVLFLSLITFQYVDHLLLVLGRSRKRIWLAGAWALVIILFLDGIISCGTSKRNIKYASEWVASEIPVGSKIVCNEARFRFYTNGRCRYMSLGGKDAANEIREIKMKGYEYLILWVDRKQAQFKLVLEDDPALVLVREFENSKGDASRIYRVNN